MRDAPDRREALIGEAKAATRQYAKAQRVWFRGRMRDWQMWQAGNAGLITV